MTSADLTAREVEKNNSNNKKKKRIMLLKKVKIHHWKLQGMQYNLSKWLF